MDVYDYDFQQLDEETFSNAKHRIFVESIKNMQKHAEINGFRHISEAIIVLYDELQSSTEVGRLMNINKSTVLKYLKRWGVEVVAPKHGTKKGYMSIMDIAKEMGMAKQNVWILINRALAKFKRNWIEMFGEPPPVGTDRDFFESLLMHHSSIAQRESEASCLSEIIWEDCDSDE